MSPPPETIDHQARLRGAIVALNKMRKRIEATEREKAEPIAVIGIGCRFPGAAGGPSAFWRVLRDGVDAMTEVPKDRWDIDAWYDPDPEVVGKMYVREGGFLSSVDGFDAGFFGISTPEAAAMDPQQRLLLEVAHEALTHAGQVPTELTNSATGVFVGVMGNDYSRLQMRSNDPTRIGPYTGTGYAWSFLAGRLSFLLGLQGPSMVVDTACSSSLVAVHLACRSLRSGESNMALAGGVNLILAPESNVVMCQLRALAPDGRCKTFDAAADGYARGEGCGVVVLKRLSDALAAGDSILALIRGSAVNHDGPSGGLTVPNGAAQQKVIREALASGKVDPSQVSYVEAHGTGTPLGDPIELRAAWSVLGRGRSAGAPLHVGSVKTNIGHLEGAAGISGLIKTVLALHHAQIPPHLHLKKLNEYIAWDQMPIQIPLRLTPWEVNPGASRIAGVSSFGLSGINAHVVLEEAPERAPGVTTEPAREVVLPLSARSPEALQTLAREYQRVLSDEGPALPDLCYTASVRRPHYEHRLATVGRTREELREQLEAFSRGEPRSGLSWGTIDPGRRPKVVFVIPGQGSQWVGMGRELHETEPVFREAIGACDAAMRRWVDWSLRDELAAGEATSRLDQTEVAQAALFAMQVALARLWASWGVTPDAVVGHSVGEVAAAHLAGALTLEDALRVVHHRGRLMQQATGLGKMASVAVSAEKAERALLGYEGRLSIAAMNDPFSVVLSGEAEALEEVLERWQRQEVYCRRLEVDYAFHSPQMAPFQSQLARSLDGLAPGRTTLSMYSTVTGALVEGPELSAPYWARNIREPVRFAAAVDALIDQGHRVFLEVGPHPVLSSNLRECLAAREEEGLVVPSLRRQQQEQRLLLESLGALHAFGCAVDWKRLYPSSSSSSSRCVPLPTYPWQRERHWLDFEPAGRKPPASARRDATSPHPLLGDTLQASVAPWSRFWEMDFSADQLPYLGDHRVQRAAVVPLSAYLEMAVAAAAEAFPESAPALLDVTVTEALGLPDGQSRRVQLVLTPQGEQVVSFTVSSACPEEHAWTAHASGTIRLDPAPEDRPDLQAIEFIQALCEEGVTGTQHYEASQACGLSHGSSFQGVEQIWRRTGEALGRVALPGVLSASADVYRMHPALLDACLQVMHAVAPLELAKTGETYLPVGVDGFRIVGQPTGALFSHATVRPSEDPEGYRGDVLVRDAGGRLVAEARGLRMRRFDAVAPRNALDGWLYELRWQPGRRKAPEGAPAAQGGDASARPPWLIFADARGLGQQLALQLEARGETAILVFPERASRGGLTCEGPRRYRLDPTHPQRFQELLGDALGGLAPRAVLHLWSLDAAPPDEAGLSWLAEAEDLGPASILHMTQALVGAGWDTPPRVFLITRGAQPLGQHPLALSAASVWGLGRTLAHEHPEMRCSMIDLSPGSNDDPEEVSALLSELTEGDREDQVALHSGARAVARLERLSAKPNAMRVRPEGTYLITGGLGGIGLAVSRWLVEQGARHLVLLGRSGASAHARATLDELEAVGVRVLAPPVDVTCREAVAGLLKEVRQTLPPLYGIIHGAGILDDGIALQLDRARLRRVMAPKVDGAWNLHCLTLDEPLDFFLLLSSMSSLFGAPGQANYAAANAFLDALAHHRRALGLPALSINWGAWARTGLAGKISGDRWTARGLDLLTPEQGLRVLGRWLGAAVAQMGVFPLDWALFLASMPSGVPPLLSDFAQRLDAPRGPENRTSTAALLRRLEEAPEEARESLLVDHIRAEVVAILGRDAARALQPGLGFFEMGMDSLMVLELRRRLQAALGRSVPAPLVFNYPSVESLGRHLAAVLIAPPLAEKQVKARQKDKDAELLAEVAQLSEAEVAAALSALADDLLQDEEENWE